MENQSQTTEQQEQVTPEQGNAIQDFFFGDGAAPQQVQQPAAAEQVVEQKAEQVQTTQEQVKETEEEVVDANEYLKNTLGLNDWEEAKRVVEEYRQIKEKGGQFDFANEDSKKVFDYLKEGKTDDVYEFLAERKKFDKYLNSELDEKLAEEIVKFGMKKQYANLPDEHIERMFNKQFGIPKKPVQGDLETEESFEERVKEWESEVQGVKTDLLIQAQIVKPELEKYKNELVLPEIKGNKGESFEPTQEDLQAFEEAKKSFLEAAEKTINGFKGLEAQVKDKDVEFVVSYANSEEEKQMINGKLQEFVNSGFNANDLFAERWVEEDGQTLKVEQMIKDLSVLYNSDKAIQKIAMDASNKRLEAYLKEKKQIDVNGATSGGVSDLAAPKNLNDQLASKIFG
jgi:hypothetical protein